MDFSRFTIEISFVQQVSYCHAFIRALIVGILRGIRDTQDAASAKEEQRGPVCKFSLASGQDDNELLDQEEAKEHRRLAARANLLARDRPDIQYSVKEIAWFMSRPTQKAWQLLKSLGRFLKLRPRYIIKYAWEHGTYLPNTFADSDFACEKETRKSTSGGMVFVGNHLVKSWSSSQTVIALSSGEAEYYALANAGSQALGIRSALVDMGIQLQIRLLRNATTGKAIAMRRGVGKIRHIETTQMWVQEKVQTLDFEVANICNKYNSADLLTKHLPQVELLDSTLKAEAISHPNLPPISLEMI